MSNSQVTVFRLLPGQDLYETLVAEIEAREIPAACLLSCVGSLRKACLRLADGKEIVERDGPFEICSLVGTLGPDGIHLHTCLADTEGNCWGGHLQPGSPVFTTAEVALLVLEGKVFRRQPCELSGWDELVVEDLPT